ncbi:bifunctional terpene synthase/polyprenyl synthetase family protein [Aspergillus stella-maris]|uniref:bifunctional terpene synthase/polyprenyl synthetase family protein n=1 Tax=Aspergillus stella-maris TaxID=1810926 RepID=UPI003CCCBBC8
MSVFDDYSFQYSRPIEASELPEGYFHILPCRLAFSAVDDGVIAQMKNDWTRVVGKDPAASMKDNKALSNFLHVIPECIPSKMAPVLRFATMVGLWDDETDTLATDMGIDMSQHQALVDDLGLAIVSLLKDGSPTSCDYKVNKLYYDTLMKSIQDVGAPVDQHNTILQGFLGLLKSQTVPPLDQVTFEAYKEQRSISSAGIFAISLIPICHNLKVSESEQASVSSFLKIGSLIAGLVNDFESFHKEFEEHTISDSLDVIHNAMAVLMANYNYTEQEASVILREEILSLERQLLADYEAWKASPSPKSSDMRSYMALCIVGVGGSCFCQATSSRYHGLELSTTAEERAKLVGCSNKNYRLNGYPPPAVSNQPPAKPNKNTENPPAEDPNDILAPFEKAAVDQTLAKFIECLRSWISIPDDSASIIEQVANLLFHSTLMVDDIEDDSLLRRGKPAAHVVYGKSQTINSATYLFAKATRDVDQLQQVTSKTAFLDELETLAHGQALDLYWKFQKTCPTISEYLTMVDHKTGGFFRMVVRVMTLESTNGEPCSDLMHLVTLMGRYYQIRDDYMNLTSDEYTGTKGYCEDLSEGKFSFPLIHTLQNSSRPTADMLRGLLLHRDSGHELSVKIKTYIVSEMANAGSLAYTRDTAMKLFDAMMETLERVETKLGPNKRLKALLLWLKL